MAGKVFSDIYNEAARDTGDTTAGHVVYVKKKVNDALREMCATMNYSWLKRTANLTLVASTQAYTISAFASDWDTDTPVDIWYRGADNKPIELDCYDDEEWKKEEDTDEGDCYGFNISKKTGAWKVSLVYVPSSAFVSSYSPLIFDYLKYPTELSADGDVPELPSSHHQTLVYWTNKLICAEMGDDNGFARWEMLSNNSLGLMKRRQVHRLGRPKRVYPRDAVTIRGRGKVQRDYNL